MDFRAKIWIRLERLQCSGNPLGDGGFFGSGRRELEVGLSVIRSNVRRSFVTVSYV